MFNLLSSWKAPPWLLISSYQAPALLLLLLIFAKVRDVILGTLCLPFKSKIIFLAIVNLVSPRAGAKHAFVQQAGLRLLKMRHILNSVYNAF
jgi:hypothetical protein